MRNVKKSNAIPKVTSVESFTGSQKQPNPYNQIRSTVQNFYKKEDIDTNSISSAMRSGFKTFEKSVAELNHLSPNDAILDAFEPSKDVEFSKRIIQYARKSFQNLEVDSKRPLDK